MTGPDDVGYYVLGEPANPALLARVRWPDHFQAMSAARPYWQNDPGLFDLPYDPSSTQISRTDAATIATSWGVPQALEEPADLAGLSVIRRMPADWSNLAAAERRAWSIERALLARRARHGEPVSSAGASSARSRRGLRRRRGRDLAIELEAAQLAAADNVLVIKNGAVSTRALDTTAARDEAVDATDIEFIDLTAEMSDEFAPAEEA